MSIFRKRLFLMKPIEFYKRCQNFHNLNNWDHMVDLNPSKGYYMFNQVRYKKNRKKRERVNLNEEQKRTKIKIPPIRLEDRTSVSEPASVISRNIKNEIMKVCVGKERTRRHFKFRNKYRIRKLLNLTHDKENVKHKNASTFVTPLTKLQHESTLPRTMDHDRFDFPHSFSYSVTWHGSSIVDQDENHVCFFSAQMEDMCLSSKEKKKIIEILGEERVDRKNQMMYLESNFFNTYNHNAAYLGDAVQFLMRRIKVL